MNDPSHPATRTGDNDRLPRSAASVVLVRDGPHGIKALLLRRRERARVLVGVYAYPGNPLHPVRQRALPGPTRLGMVAWRFAPCDGFEGWFR